MFFGEGGLELFFTLPVGLAVGLIALPAFHKPSRNIVGNCWKRGEIFSLSFSLCPFQPPNRPQT